MLTEFVAKEIQKFHTDYNIYDYFDGYWAKKAACYRNIPHEPDINIFNLGNSPYLKLIYISRLFQPYSQYLDNTFKFIGAYIDRKCRIAPPLKFPYGSRPLLIVSFGSTDINDNIILYKKIWNDLKYNEYRLVLNCDRFLSHSEEVPVHFQNPLPMLDILPRTSLIIYHGGMNSLMESIYFGVPMILIPFNADEFFYAKHAEVQGLRICIPKEKVSYISFSEIISNLNFKQIKRNIRRIQQSLIGLGGAKRGRDEILRFIRSYTGISAKQ